MSTERVLLVSLKVQVSAMCRQHSSAWSGSWHWHYMWSITVESLYRSQRHRRHRAERRVADGRH